MLQVFRIGVVKVDRDVEHVAMAMHVCFKCTFQITSTLVLYLDATLFFTGGLKRVGATGNKVMGLDHKLLV